MIEVQQKNRGWSQKGGFIVTNPNCTTIHLVLALKPLQDAFGLKKVLVTSLQSLSGAGYPGVPSLDIVDNVIPFIGGEEDKVETEPLKIMGGLEGGKFVDSDFVISATCTRVAVREAHTESVSVELGRRASLEEVAAALAEWEAEPQRLGLPSAPARPVILRSEADRPQPFLDRDGDGAMATTVGRLRSCPILDYKFVLTGHNTIRGAAGASILNAELLVAQGLIK
jgi:aspartate-semialdehyde dehydrogenase